MTDDGTSRWGARKIMGNNFMDYMEVCEIWKTKLSIPEKTRLDVIPFSPAKLIECKDDYVLFPGLTQDGANRPLTINRIIFLCGKIPGVKFVQAKNSILSEEAADITKMDFVKRETCELKWYLLRKAILSGSLRKSFFDQEERFTGETQIRERAVVYVYTWLIRRLLRKKLIFNEQAIWCADNGDGDLSQYQAYVHFRTNKIMIMFCDPRSARNRLGLVPSMIPDIIQNPI
ncbi:MAG: hypothetical protein A2745_01555 [Candidatus Harrisonbacteria bacterium RIFCSPHIGHO2_01_FULL_44_13]|nr:MAG: hypothetical protein A2745_01555 [Candidatus Harrisonbacteria bacterium RIFCSPHIGHO2_01_FULL_44_13]